jgi:hypothetical protein
MTGFPLGDAQTITVTIDCAAKAVYDAVRDPMRLSQWASGVEAAVVITFAPDNEFGILDHEVYLPDGRRVKVPMRVVPLRGRSVLSLTLFRQPGATDDDFIDDAQWVLKDLESLKTLLESY